MRQGLTHKRHPPGAYAAHETNPSADPVNCFTLSASSRKRGNEFLYIHGYFLTSGPRVAAATAVETRNRVRWSAERRLALFMQQPTARAKARRSRYLATQ